MNPVYDPTLSVPDKVGAAACIVYNYFAEHGIHNWELMGICSRKRVYELEEQLKRANERQPVTLKQMPDEIPIGPGNPSGEYGSAAGRDERSWIACEDKIAESLFRLAHEIRDSRKTQEALLKFLQDNLGAATKKDLEQLVKKIMATVTEQLNAFADKVEAQFNEIGTNVDNLNTSVTGIDVDVQALKKQIEEFQNSTGSLSLEDQARLDALETQAGKLAVKTKAAADAVAVLDAATETVPVP